jgi:hypothetical protein
MFNIQLNQTSWDYFNVLPGVDSGCKSRSGREVVRLWRNIYQSSSNIATLCEYAESVGVLIRLWSNTCQRSSNIAALCECAESTGVIIRLWSNIWQRSSNIDALYECAESGGVICNSAQVQYLSEEFKH